MLKNNKAVGRDDVLVEQLKHLGPNANKWLHTTGGAKSFWEEASRRFFGANIGYFIIEIIRHLRINYLTSDFSESTVTLAHPISEEEYRKGIVVLKNNKAVGRDDVLVEQLKHLGPNANKWLHTTGGAKSFWEEASRRIFGANIGYFIIEIIRHLRINYLSSDFSLTLLIQCSTYASQEQDPTRDGDKLRYRHTQARKDCDSEEQQTNLSLIPYVQTIGTK